MILPTMPCQRCGGTGQQPDGRALPVVRERLGLTLTAMARKLKVTTAYLCMVESGATKMSPAVYQRLVDAYGKMDWPAHTHSHKKGA